jgi:hypothetical protein
LVLLDYINYFLPHHRATSYQIILPETAREILEYAGIKNPSSNLEEG